MLVTLLPNATLVTLVRRWNASSPMLVTGSPVTVSGIVTVPPSPLYPVMLMAPAFVVQLNWALTLVGKASRSSASRSFAGAFQLWVGFGLFICCPGRSASRLIVCGGCDRPWSCCS